MPNLSVCTEHINSTNLRAMHQVLSVMARNLAERRAASEFLLTIAKDLEDEILVRDMFKKRTRGERGVLITGTLLIKESERKVMLEFFDDIRKSFEELNPNASAYWEEICLLLESSGFRV